jgi:hypothetical protein
MLISIRLKMLSSILLGIFCGIIFYVMVVHPWGIKTCLINSYDCLKVQYQQKNGTVLAHEITQNVYIWFDGKDVLLYGQPTGQICESDTEPVFVWDLKTNEQKGYLCAKPLKEVLLLYSQEPVQYFSFKTNTRVADLADIIDIMIDKQIIGSHIYG